MNDMKIGKIILIVLGVALLALGVKGLMDIPGQQAMLNAAVYLDEPVVLPENEGKLVIIHGKPEMTAPAYDEELGLTLNAIKAYRYDEEYKLKSSEKLLYKYGWVSKGSKGIVGTASLGEFALDEKTLNGFAADSEYEDFDMAEVSAKGYVVGRGKTKEGAWTKRWARSYATGCSARRRYCPPIPTASWEDLLYLYYSALFWVFWDCANPKQKRRRHKS